MLGKVSASGKKMSFQTVVRRTRAGWLSRCILMLSLAAFSASAVPTHVFAADQKKPANVKKPAAKKPAQKSRKPAARSIADPAAAAPPPMPPAGVIVEPATLSPRDRDIFARAVKAAEKHDWGRARSIVADSRNQTLHKIIDWAYLREPGPHVGFTERAAFVKSNPDWPGQNEIRRQAEANIEDTIPAGVIDAWFVGNPPLTTAGKVAYARALLALGRTEEAHKLAREAWTTGTFDRSDESDFLRAFAGILTADDHWARIDRILYDEQTSAAERLLRYVDGDRQTLARVRMALITSAKNVDGLLKTVPAQFQDDAGLLYDRIKWRMARGDDDGALALVPEFSAGGPRPELWWRLRAQIAREALNKGRVTDAYRIATHHGCTDPLSVSEAEWLAGWIALRFLKDGEAALPHFEKVYDSVQTPTSLARGAYWTGRAAEFLGRPDIADEWYQRAGTFVTTYYGQLALARMIKDVVPQLPADPLPTAEERAAFEQRDVTHALRALLDVDAKSYQRAFAIALSSASGNAADRQLTAELLTKKGRSDLGVVIARDAARDKIILVQYGYPVPAYAYPDSPERALVLAITRQESNFDPGASSGAGAKGLMQLMPATASSLARAARIPYNKNKLTADPAFNIRLGSSYLKSLVDTFDGSYVLAAAAYNAGPGRARQWLRQFGDLHDAGVDPIDWVEQIPFSETRSYVQRIMENVMVYRAIINGTPKIEHNLEKELAHR